MKIQRFEGKNPEEALRMAQMALGPDAVVLQTRRIQDSGMLKLVRRPRVEVLVAVDAGPKPVAGHGSRVAGREPDRPTPDPRPVTRDPRPSEAAPSWHDEMAALRREM